MREREMKRLLEQFIEFYRNRYIESVLIRTEEAIDDFIKNRRENLPETNAPFTPQPRKKRGLDNEATTNYD